MNRLLLGEINIINFETDDDDGNDEHEDDENEQSTNGTVSDVEPTARDGW